MIALLVAACVGGAVIAEGDAPLLVRTVEYVCDLEDVADGQLPELLAAPPVDAVVIGVGHCYERPAYYYGCEPWNGWRRLEEDGAVVGDCPTSESVLRVEWLEVSP